jgi:hypothetical protein
MISDQFSRTKGTTGSFELSIEGRCRNRNIWVGMQELSAANDKLCHRIRKEAEQHGWDKSLH